MRRKCISPADRQENIQKSAYKKVRRCVTIRSGALFDPDGMKKEKKESAVLDPLNGWGTRSAATTWQTGSSNRRTSDPVLYDRPLYGTRRDMYRKPSEMVLVYHRRRRT